MESVTVSDDVRLEKFEGFEITDEILGPAVDLFTEHYGVWGIRAEEQLGSFAKAGKKVRLSTSKLREKCIPLTAPTTLIRAAYEDKIVGHVIAVRWVYESLNVCWIAQLVVHKNFRRQRIATRLIKALRKEDDFYFGVLSSHPATIRATLTACGGSLNQVNHELIRGDAAGIMAISPIQYVRTVPLRGLVWEFRDGESISANTKFFVDHGETLRALAEIRSNGIDWPLGQLPEGHEFLIIVAVQDGYSDNDPRLFSLLHSEPEPISERRSS